MKISEATSQLRTVLRIMEDAMVTDRTLWSLLLLYAKTVMKRTDKLGTTKNMEMYFKPLPCITLIETTRNDCGDSVCIVRTESKIPRPLEGTAGPLIRTVSSADGSTEVVRTTPSTYASMRRTSSFKHNKTPYYWYEDAHLYFPEVEWDTVIVTGIFETDPTRDTCKRMQDSEVTFPDFIMGEVERLVKLDFAAMAGIPVDQAISDKMNVLRQ